MVLPDWLFLRFVPKIYRSSWTLSSLTATLKLVDTFVLHREHSRYRKFLQLQRDQHAFFEPALHYWRRAQNYWFYCAVPVETRGPVHSFLTQESKWQYTLRPQLSAPWVHRILCELGYRAPASTSSTTTSSS